MDESRRLKFIKQYDEKLQELLKREENTLFKKELSKYFYELANKELTKSQSGLWSHNPKQTIKLLRKFKYEDGSGFKELVHDTDLSRFSPKEILEEVKNDPNFISSSKNEKVKGFIPIHKFTQIALNVLIKNFEDEGIPFYEKTSKHPYGHDKSYTDTALEFKKKYRFGSGREYTKFSDLLVTLSEQEKYQAHFLQSNIHFLPDRRRFDIRANFFSWTESINFGLKYFFDGIMDHGNIKGKDTYDPTHKTIEVECIRLPTEKKLRIGILDKESVSKKDPNTLLKYFRESNAFKVYFRSLCDWIVEADLDKGKPVKINVLREDHGYPDIQLLDRPIGGFKHILEFYDF